MPRIEIKGEQHPIGEVFSERFAFVVPPYQRPYSWTTEHAGELLDDLLSYIGDGDQPVEELNPYFLGSIVLIKGDRPEAQIVDGQQRLITLTILLAVLRALMPTEFSDGITRLLYEPANLLNNISARYRLRPKERDADFFQSYIQSEGGIHRLHEHLQHHLNDSQRNIRENALYYHDYISRLPEVQRVLLAQFIVQRCLLVVVSTPDLSSAYRIFSVLNDRGLDLSTSDILKAEIVGKIPEAIQQEYTQRWEDTEESLGREAFDELFAHICAIYRKSRKRGNILDDFRAYVLAAIDSPQQFIDDVLKPLGATFYVIRSACYEHPTEAERVNTMLRWLNRIDNADWIPPAMLFLSRYHDEPDWLARFFTDLERLAASLMIRRQFWHRRAPRYARLMIAIERGDDMAVSYSPIQLNADEREATIGVLSGDVYLMAVEPRRYLLLRLDSNLAGSDNPVYPYKMLTVEHVLPRNPPKGSEWERWFPTLEERALHVHRLGNLALLSRTKNYLASNYDFERKKTIYFTGRDGVAPFALTTQVLREREWTPEVVERRQEELVERLKQLWRL